MEELVVLRLRRPISGGGCGRRRLRLSTTDTSRRKITHDPTHVWLFPSIATESNSEYFFNENCRKKTKLRCAVAPT